MENLTLQDLSFEAHVTWDGANGDRRGTVRTGGETIAWSGPASMGGLGVGTSPEELLMSGVAACFTSTLGGALRRARLPAGRITTRVAGSVTGYPREMRFASITVHPEVAGGDPSRLAEYRQTAAVARDRCFIGSVVRDHLEYAVGEVTVRP